VAHFFADVGKLLLMFFAGLEIDLVHFRRTGRRSLAFGLATFALACRGPRRLRTAVSGSDRARAFKQPDATSYADHSRTSVNTSAHRSQTLSPQQSRGENSFAQFPEDMTS
jgi:hypothetical protein